jgi:hypothetical protein
MREILCKATRGIWNDDRGDWRRPDRICRLFERGKASDSERYIVVLKIRWRRVCDFGGRIRGLGRGCCLAG